MDLVVLKPGSRFKTFGDRTKRLVMQRRCTPLWSPKPRNNKLMLTDSPYGCVLATMPRKTSGDVDSPTDQWQTWQKLSEEYQL